jgi:hypothetical protein
MSRTNRSDDFAYRVNFAASVISRGVSTTRNFDNCFENYDGDAVVVSLYRRSRRNPKLRSRIFKYLDRRGMVLAAFKHRRQSVRDITLWAAELRTSAKAAHAKWMAERDAENAAQKACALAAGYSMEHVEGVQFRLIRPDGSAGPIFWHESSFAHFASLDMADVAVPA